MKDRTHLLHALLAIGAVVMAGFAAFGEFDAIPDEDGVVVVPMGHDQLRAIEWEDDRYKLSLKKPGAKEDSIKVSVLKKVAPPDIPEGQQEQSSPAHANNFTKIFPGSQAAKELFENVTPFRAIRSLGILPDKDLDPLGLQEATTHLEFRTTKGGYTLKVGAAAYGSGDRYVLAENREVFLVKSKTLNGLRHGASGLLERKALPLDRQEVRRVSVKGALGAREFSHRHATEPKKAFFSDPGAPDEKLEQVSTWMDRVLKLRVADVIQDTPKGTPTLSVEFFNGSRGLGALSVWDTAEEGPVARSTFFEHTISLSKANVDSIIRDLGAVFDEGA